MNAPDDASSNVPTLKNDALVSSKVEANESTGQWNITETVGLGANLFYSETPECLEGLKEAAEHFEADEKVVAFVILEDTPLADSYSNIREVPRFATNKPRNEQNDVLATIEEDVIEQNDELEVRYQFTYLTNAISIETPSRNLAEIAHLDNGASAWPTAVR